MPAGRRSKLTPELTEELCKAISLGSTFKLAAQSVGISEGTLYRWLADGRDGKAKYQEFFKRVKKAEFGAAQACLAVIRRAALEGRWQAAAWLLERRYTDQYGRINKQVAEAHDESAGEKQTVDDVRALFGLPSEQKANGDETN